MTTLPAPNAAMERLEQWFRDYATSFATRLYASDFIEWADELATLRQALAQQEAEPYLITRDQAIDYARANAYALHHEHDYLPKTVEAAKDWQPHEWVIAAIRWARPYPVAHPAPVAQQEAVAWIAPDKIARLQEGYSATVYGSIAREESDTCRDYATTPLFTAPVAHSPAGVVTDEMVERACVAYDAVDIANEKAWPSAMRAALLLVLAGHSPAGVDEALSALLWNIVDNLNDTPVNEDWAQRTAYALCAALNGEKS